MAILDPELYRIKYELGYNLETIGAEPYVGFFRVFDQVVQAFMQAGATTTSSTTVVASTTATAANLTLASATGFVAGARIIVDVDAAQEAATIQNLSGAVATVLLQNAHAGTYPVTVDGGESIVREILATLRQVAAKIVAAAKTAGLKRAEDIEWFPGQVLKDLRDQRDYWRDELASAIGVANLWKVRRGGAQTVSLY